MTDFGPRAPHGPDMTGTHDPLDSIDTMHLHEREAFDSLIRPDDSYTPEGVYWADLPWGKKFNFVTSYDTQETKREFLGFWKMFKEDPLEPVRFYFGNMVLPGAGLGLEGYVLFSIGNIKPLFAAVWPECWGKDPTVCNETWIHSVEYLEICGIIVGQILVGLLGDAIGRRWGLIQDATIMFLGLIMLVAAWGVTLNGWVICYAWSLFFYGIGVGGEYPMTATSGMENAVGSGRITTKEDRLHRGRKVTSAFLMQGWGQFFNQVLLIILLLCFHHGSGNDPYSKVAAQWTYRVSFAIPAVGTLWLVYYRCYKMKAASKALDMAKRKAGGVTGYDPKALKLCFQKFGGRLFATSVGWFMNDVFFYGNKLFQSEFINVIIPNSNSIMPGWLYNLINVGVSLCGYYLASFMIDNKLYGRKKMQIVGFMMDFILFVIPAFKYHYYLEPAHVHAFQAMYFLSSFFNQFGPNSVSFLVAAEVFPTPVRASAHGFAAASGKLGALLASVLYNYIDTQTKFYVVPWFGLAGMLVTFVFLPDTTGLDLKEQERRWLCITQGRDQDYHGPAIHAKHLSLWERWRGVGKNYNAEEDYRQKVTEMRKDWEELMARRAAEKESEREIDDADLHEGLKHKHVFDYFHRTSPMMLGKEKPKHEFNKMPPLEELPPPQADPHEDI
ncbi:hypothetical protein KEM56_006224 [Ascosphaera pollenicola]|nr:hypothetical protein KEM56_006224 [Ascosphaera pollenicola]